MDLYNLISFILSVCLLIFYHVHFLYNLVKNPEKCLSGWYVLDNDFVLEIDECQNEANDPN